VTQANDLMAPLGAVIAAIGSAGFPACLATFLRTVTPYAHTVVFGYCGEARPIDLYDDFPDDRRDVFVAEYQAGPYLLDPFYLAATRPVGPGLYRMRDLAPDRFYQGEYFRTYYARTGLAEEIAFFADAGPDDRIVLSLMRSDRPFSTREMRQLDTVQPVVQAVLRQHWSDLRARFGPADALPPRTADDRVDQTFQRFGEGQLTAREREVVEFTLKGHSADAIGGLLGIAPGTVRIHRRNIYLKLQIRSQGELFSMFLRRLSTA
jgi:DNA-binding CsgD family transcriptional regulator